MDLGSDISKSKQVVESVEINNCCICLEPLDKRTHVTLKCRHQYHLDCIGSAYNSKNEMQCPTCRQVEDGEWLYAQPPPNPLDPDYNLDDWFSEPEQDPLELSLDMPTMGFRDGQVRPETVLPYAHRLTSFVPNQISELFTMHYASGLVNPPENMQLQYQLRNNLAWHANQPRLTDMSHMLYGFGSSGGGFSRGGASSSGGNGGWGEANFANGGGTNRRGRCFCGFCDR